MEDYDSDYKRQQPIANGKQREARSEPIANGKLKAHGELPSSPAVRRDARSELSNAESSSYDESYTSDESDYTDMESDSVFNSHINDVVEPDATAVKRALPKRKSKISKVNIILLVILFLASTWGYICNRITSDENTYMNAETKYYIGLAAPIANSLTTLIESIQVGMEVKDDRADKKKRARRAAKAEAMNPLSSGQAPSGNAVNLSVGANSSITLKTVVQQAPRGTLHGQSHLRNNTIDESPPSSTNKHIRHYSHGDKAPSLPPNFDDRKLTRPNHALVEANDNSNMNATQPAPVPMTEAGISATERSKIADDLKTSFAVLFKNMKKRKAQKDEADDSSL